MSAPHKLVLLISHDPHLRAILRRALEAEGYLVGEAANSTEGVRTIQRVKPDAVIADLQMEVVESGDRVIEKLRAANAGHVLYLVTSGTDALSDQFDTHRLGVAGIFLKPVDPAVVIAALRPAI